jgi:hypothetical protein
MTKTYHNQIIFRAKNYVNENWGSPFIIAFILLLIGDAVSLSLGLSYFADNIAVYAFYALVIGVVLQLICFLKYQRKSEAQPF